MSNATDVYVVKSGDTLSGIANTTGRSISDLIRLNGIKNRNVIQPGQVLYLRETTVFAVQVLFLDALRYPIANLKYRLLFDGKVVTGKTGDNGLSQEIVTAGANSLIEIKILDLYGKWLHLSTALSDYGRKRITLVSPYLVFDGQLEPHPPGAPNLPGPRKKPLPDAPGAPPPLPPVPPGSPSKNNPLIRPNKTHGKHGESILQIGIDLPQDLLAYMQAYDGEAITEKDWEKFSGDLECETNVLKAIARVESGGRDAFWTINDSTQHRATAPKIVFERHHFHDLTKGKYDNTHPDISSEFPYVRRRDHLLGSAYNKLPDGKVDQDDLYDNKQDYLRLIHAYRLDREAALMATSWGKFQILGENWKLCKETSISNFVAKMCKNESGQIELLARFIRNKLNQVNKNAPWQPLLWNAVKQKDWTNIAIYYNGPKQQGYDKAIKSAYEYYCKNVG